MKLLHEISYVNKSATYCAVRTVWSGPLEPDRKEVRSWRVFVYENGLDFSNYVASGIQF